MNDFETTKQVSPLTNSELECDVARDFLDNLMGEYDFTLPEKAYCILRAALSTEAQPEVTGAVAYRITDGEGGFIYSDNLPNSESVSWSEKYGRAWEPLYPPSAIEAAVREKLKEAARICDEQQKEPECPERASYCAKAIRALINT